MAQLKQEVLEIPLFELCFQLKTNCTQARNHT